MEGIVAPTDSRFRGDQRLLEEGEFDEAENEKLEIEKQQRRTRKKVQDGLLPPPKPWFFVEKPHPFITDDFKDFDYGTEKPIFYELIEGNGKGYWERREKGDWSDLPNLWGPFEEEDS